MRKRVFVMVAFGDVRGSGAFMQQSEDGDPTFDRFWDEYDAILRPLMKTSDHFKDLGDGFMSVVELPATGHRCQAAILFLSRLYRVGKQMERIIRDKKYPRPDGFRIRVTCGFVTKRPNGDVRGRCVNLASKALSFGKTELFIIHEKFKELMNDKQMRHAGFTCERLPKTPRMIPDGYKRDLMALWIVERIKTPPLRSSTVRPDGVYKETLDGLRVVRF